MKVKTIKKEKWDAIKRIAEKEAQKEESRIAEKLLKENLSKKEVELKVDKEYQFIHKSKENLGSKKWLDIYTKINYDYVEITKETDCYILGKWKSDRIKKENILAIVEE